MKSIIGLRSLYRSRLAVTADDNINEQELMTNRAIAQVPRRFGG